MAGRSRQRGDNGGLMVGGRHVVRYAFAGPRDRRDAVPAAVEYWQSRRFRCQAEGEGLVVGRRGSWLGNVLGNDMRRLRCDLDVALQPSGRVQSRLIVEGAFQYLSAWSFAELSLEQVLFRRALLGLPSPAHLERFRAESRRAAVLGTLSFTVLGRRLPRFWEQMLRELSAPDEPPTVERG
jgi:hypothetical protein